MKIEAKRIGTALGAVMREHLTAIGTFLTIEEVRNASGDVVPLRQVQVQVRQSLPIGMNVITRRDANNSLTIYRVQ
jgi:hypothetical protein